MEFWCDSDNYPDCRGKSYSIIHVVAESLDKRSAIHYLWSVIYSPTIVVAYFEKTGVNVTVDWKKVLMNVTDGISFNEYSEYITALVIPAIYEFQDPKDALFYTDWKKVNIHTIVKHPFHKLNWEKPVIDHENNITTFKASMLGGEVTFQVSHKNHLNFVPFYAFIQMQSFLLLSSQLHVSASRYLK